MDQKDKSRFTQIMLGMADNFRDTITKEGMQMRFDMLREFSMEEIEFAARKIMQNRKYTKMPPVAEFFDAIKGKAGTRALEAWGSVVECLKRGNEPDDPIAVEAIRRIGGWSWLMRQSYDELHWLEKRFVEHYDSYEQKKQTALPEPEAEVKQLAGAVRGL